MEIKELLQLLKDNPLTEEEVKDNVAKMKQVMADRDKIFKPITKKFLDRVYNL